MSRTDEKSKTQKSPSESRNNNTEKKSVRHTLEAPHTTHILYN